MPVHKDCGGGRRPEKLGAGEGKAAGGEKRLLVEV